MALPFIVYEEWWVACVPGIEDEFNQILDC
jgi:hypothetical protein